MSGLSVYAAGTAANLPTSGFGPLVFDTTSPNLTITAPGTYLLLTRVVLNDPGTAGDPYSVQVKLTRTNNTAGDIANSLTTSSDGWPNIPEGAQQNYEIHCPPILYTTANSNDIISIYANAPGAVDDGITVTEASIVAIPIGSGGGTSAQLSTGDFET